MRSANGVQPNNKAFGIARQCINQLLTLKCKKSLSRNGFFDRLADALTFA